MTEREWKNKLYFGDNLGMLRDHIPNESVDLIYLDPPFNSKTTYNVLFQEKNGTQSAAQITAFEDTWHWGIESEAAYHEVVTGGGKLADLVGALRQFLGTNDMMAYLTMMAIRLHELHRVLKPTGSIYLHCDPTASHYLKLLLDACFGINHFQNEVIWKRTAARSDSHRWNRVHDVLLFYSKSDKFAWHTQYLPYDDQYVERFYRHKDPDTGCRYTADNLTAAGVRRGSSGQPWRGIDPTARGRHWAIPGYARPLLENPNTGSVQEALDQLDAIGRIIWPKKEGGVPRFKRYLDEMPGVALQSVVTNINPIGAQASERLGYPTQKPEALLERIISASSNEGDIVLDPFCGCGTAIAVAERLHRRWIGIDVTHLAVTLMRHRLHDTFANELSPYEVIGDPKDLAGARALALENRYQFEWWALGLVEAQPAQDKRKGADKGIDGLIYFIDNAEGKVKRIVVQVKSGHVSAPQVQQLKGAMENENAAIGLFITLEEPTRPMIEEAATAGFYEAKELGKKYPRLQILTVEELLDGKQSEYPRGAGRLTYKQAKRRRKQAKTQPSLLDD